MKRLQGERWIHSRANRAFELSLVGTASPVLAAIGAAGVAGVAICDPAAEIFLAHERALTPEYRYTITKIGQPTERNLVSQKLNTTGIDEIPQILAIFSGKTSLVGPRGTEPEHRERMFDCITGIRADRWRKVLEAQRPGLISSYANEIHALPPRSLREEQGLTDQQITYEAEVRYENDSRDFHNASLGYNMRLVKNFLQMMIGKINGE